MKSSDASPGKHLKAEDLNGRQIAVTISHVTMEDVGSGQKKERKPICYSREPIKGWS